MAANMSIVLVNAGLEALLRFVGDLNFELTEIPSAVLAGSVVGACSLYGGLIIGGGIGVIVGGSVGHQINMSLPRIRNVGNMLQELATHQLRDLINLLISGIQNTVSTLPRRNENENLSLTELLERFGSNSDVRMNIIQTLINFLNGIHGGTFQVIP